MDTAGIESGPLFRPVPGRIGEVRLGPAAICGVIKRRAKQAGITRRVSGHSLRVGAALSLAERNASVAEMQREGRWKSFSMPAYYVRNQEASRGAVARWRGCGTVPIKRTRRKLQKALAIRETVVLTSNNASYLTTVARKMRTKCSLGLDTSHVNWIDRPPSQVGSVTHR